MGEASQCAFRGSRNLQRHQHISAGKKAFPVQEKSNHIRQEKKIHQRGRPISQKRNERGAALSEDVTSEASGGKMKKYLLRSGDMVAH